MPAVQRRAFRNEPYQMKYCRVWLSPKISPKAQDEDHNQDAVHESAVVSSTDSSMRSVHHLSSSSSSSLQVPKAASTPCSVSPVLTASAPNSCNTTPGMMATNIACGSCSSDDESACGNNSGTVSALALTPKEEQQQPASPTVRAPSRTMQHLLQNVPYLFLDTVSNATVLTQERSVSHSTRVGDSVSTWSCPAAAAAATINANGSNQLRDIFVAQLPFDMPLSALQELADLLLPGQGVQIVHAAPHYRRARNSSHQQQHQSNGGQTYDGCAFVKMTEAHASLFIGAFHKRVLFDVDGVWVAASDNQVKELTDYCAWMQEQNPEQRRKILPMPTPFSAMTAEFAMRATRQNNGNNNNGFHNHATSPAATGYHHHYNQQQQQQQMMMQQHYPSMTMVPPMMPSYRQHQQRQQTSGGNNFQYGY